MTVRTLTLTVVVPFSCLIDCQPNAAPDFLSFFYFGSRLVERAYLENVRTVPAFTECRVRKDKAGRFIKRHESLLVFHNQVVSLNIFLCLTGGAILEDDVSCACASLCEVGGLHGINVNVSPAVVCLF